MFGLPAADDPGEFRHTSLVATCTSVLYVRLHPLGERVAAVENETGHLEREQADRGKQHDRNKPHVAQHSGSCGLATQARPRAIGEGLRGGSDCFGVLYRAGLGGGRETPAMRTSRASN